jgi:hypothetical protein
MHGRGEQHAASGTERLLLVCKREYQRFFVRTSAIDQPIPEQSATRWVHERDSGERLQLAVDEVLRGD